MKKILFAFALLFVVVLSVILSGCTFNFSINTNWAVSIDSNLRLMMEESGDLILWMRKADVL